MADLFIDGDIILKPNKSHGLKVGSKQVVSENISSTFTWRDITGQILVKGVGVNDPTWEQIAATPFWAFNFAVNDSCWMVYHIPHDIVPDADIYFHSHWISDGTETASVRWEYTYSYQKGFSQGAFNMTGTSVYSEEASSGIAYTHMITETAGITLSGLDEPDGLILCRIKRVTNTDSPHTDNSDNIYLLTADVHYQSTNIGTANKSPFFYR